MEQTSQKTEGLRPGRTFVGRLAFWGIILLPVVGIALFSWWVIEAREQRWLEGMDLEGFNAAQMETWKQCNEVYDQLGKLEQKLEAFDDPAGPSNKHERVRVMALYVPVVCKFLSQQRQLRRREKSEVDPLFDAVRALRNAEIVRERSLSWSADKRASSAAEITRMDDEIARLSGVLSADVLGHDREQMALSMTLGRYAGPSEVAARRACIEAVILPVQF